MEQQPRKDDAERGAQYLTGHREVTAPRSRNASGPVLLFSLAFDRLFGRVESRSYIRANTRDTCTADHGPPPRAVGMARSLRAAAMARRLVMPACWMALMVGPISAAL
jgi:hypothetical protein